MPSPGFEPKPYGTAVSVTNYYSERALTSFPVIAEWSWSRIRGEHYIVLMPQKTHCEEGQMYIKCGMLINNHQPETDLYVRFIDCSLTIGDETPNFKTQSSDEEST
ncbi:hypothetical protein TNCV_2110461 [Trichonephila clavipes]|nr:hypothetical protein TNCV_2110461 [Trichonephila clavipes]